MQAELTSIALTIWQMANSEQLFQWKNLLIESTKNNENNSWLHEETSLGEAKEGNTVLKGAYSN